MPWKLARVTEDLVADSDWTGIVLGVPDAPDESIFFSVGTSGGAELDSQSRVEIRVGWLDDTMSPILGRGASLDAQAISLETLVTPTGQTMQVVSSGTVLSTVAWLPLQLQASPRGRWSVRLSNMSGPGGATRVGVWYWAGEET